MRLREGMVVRREPHLARALRSYVGRTAMQLREGDGGAIALSLDQRSTS